MWVTVTDLGNQNSAYVSDCHSIQLFSVSESPFWDIKNSHCSRIVTLTGETVTDRACIDNQWSSYMSNFQRFDLICFILCV